MVARDCFMSVTHLIFIDILKRCCSIQWDEVGKVCRPPYFTFLDEKEKIETYYVPLFCTRTDADVSLRSPSIPAPRAHEGKAGGHAIYTFPCRK